ncbi:hypothetical protein GGF43_004049, partial [Coemansia sp. RSA 2618]
DDVGGELDDLERELGAMSLEAPASTNKHSADAQTQQMADRLAKLGLSSQNQTVPV